MLLSPSFITEEVSDTFQAQPLATRNQLVGRYLFDVFPDNLRAQEPGASHNLRASLEQVWLPGSATNWPCRTTIGFTYLMVDGHQPLTDSQWWQVIEPLLPVRRKCRYCLRQILDAMRYICRTGRQWRNLPPGFSPWPAVQYYVARWRADGTFEHLSQASNRANRLAQGRRPTPSLALVDAQTSPAPGPAAGP